MADASSARRPAGASAAVRGALWMGGALQSFTLMAVAVRELLRTLGYFEILFLRSAACLVFLLPVMMLSGVKHWKRLHVATGVLFTLFWIGTFITWVFFLPHSG